jgi:hypothetical protein
MRKKLFFLALVFGTALPFVVARAENTDNANLNSESNRGSAIKLRNEERQENREQILEQRCKNIETRVDTRVKRYENNRQRHVNVYRAMKERIARLVARVEAAGVDATKLKNDLETLDGKIKKLDSDYANFIDGLKTTQDYACGKSEGHFRAKLGEARKGLATARTQWLEIKNYFQGTVRADIQDLKKKLAETKSEAESNL